MTSRERVLAAFDHEEPDRVPAWCGASPEFMRKAGEVLGCDAEGVLERFGDDFRRVSERYDGPDIPLSPGSTWRSPFGVERDGIGYGQPRTHPLAGASLADVLDHPWPDPAWMDVSCVREDALAWRGEYAILGGSWAPFWHDAIDLMGMEGLYYAMYDAPEVVDAMLGRIVGFYREVSRRTFDAAGDVIDIFFIGNDFGSQTGPLMGEDLFRRFMMPHLADLAGLGHAYGLRVMLHCCGGFEPLIPAMIEAGLDGLHAIQPSCHGMDLRTLKEIYGGRILLNGAIDSHHVLIEGTPDLVRARTREVLDIMMPGGGYVAGASHDYILGETPVENVLAMFDTIREYGVYR